MRRFKYNLNSVFQQDANLQRLRPTFMLETVPGETFSGSIETHCIGNQLVAYTLNRVYWDHFVFYVPYRLLWDKWEKFIVARSTAGGDGDNQDDTSLPTQIPSIASAGDRNDAIANWFWCHQAQFADSGDAVSALPFRAYNLIWNLHFRAKDQARVDEDQTSDLDVAAKATHFHERLYAQDQTSTTAIPSGTVDDLRTALAEDYFQRRRDLSGDKYSDYLRSQGMETGGVLIEEPELWAKTGATFQSVVATGTGGTAATNATKGGYYQLQNKINLGRKVAPEHGIILGLAVIRMEAPHANASHPIWGAYKHEHFWQPEFDATGVHEDDANLSRTIHRNDNAAWAPDLDNLPPRWLRLKSGFHIQTGTWDGTAGGSYNAYNFRRAGIAFTDSAATAKTEIQQPARLDFANALGTEIQTFGAMQNFVRLQKESPIVPNPTQVLR